MKLNWKTTTCAVIAGVGGLVQLLLEHDTELKSVLGPVWESKIYTTAIVTKLIFLPLGIALAKDFNLTGGTVPATPEAVERVEQTTQTK